MVTTLSDESTNNGISLPLDVLSNIASLIHPPFVALPPPEEPTTTPQIDVIHNIDPQPAPPQSHLQLLSLLTRSSSHALEAARPWLWEDVDVLHGRGWLAIVNALTEEIVEIEEVIPEAGPSTLPASTLPEPIPISGPEAHKSPATISDGFQSYIAIPPQAIYPDPYGSMSSSPPMAYSPPQPSHIRDLLTPPGSRGNSPHPGPSSYFDAQHQSQSSTPPPMTRGVSHPAPTALKTKSTLRGRSRSPRRSVNFDTESISSVLTRSRSNSGNVPGGSGFLRRQTSLSKAHHYDDIDDFEDDEMDEVKDSITPLRGFADLRNPKIFARGSAEPKENVNPDLLPPPGPYIRHLSFINFRTIGSRRSQEEAVRGRFVTAGRLEGVIKNAPNLVSLGMTEYVDSALSYPVIEELFFRGYRKPRYHSPSKSLTRVRSLSVGPSALNPQADFDQLDPPRPTYAPYEDETEDEKWKRRSVFAPLEALDLTGCVSNNFTEGMNNFYATWLIPDDDSGDDDRGRERSRARARGRQGRHDGHNGGYTTSEMTEDDSDAHGSRPKRKVPKFRALKRLSLRACTRLEPTVLTAFIFACPNLTHLDLSGTRIPSELLAYLTEKCPRSLRLTSLSLARCPRLDPQVMVDFLCRCPAARNLVDLNLFVNPTQGNVIEPNDLMRLITEAPCIKSGRLRYLDLSSARFTPAHLTKEVWPTQPSLISLGLSHIPTLSLPPIADFLLEVAPNVEVLTLTGTATTTNLVPTLSPLQLSLELHARLINPLTTVPFSLSNLNISGGSQGINLKPGPTRLRVLELSPNIRRSITPNGEWQIVKSKGGRGWYVDLSCGWRRRDGDIEGKEGWEFVRHLPRSDPRRRWLNHLSESNGKVGSNVGWHSRKMEVVKGMGMLGREEGLAGVGAFAFEE
ncbi:uncharacterized protein I303_101246 [Kwoniella dejecticola CBS 10117]|uniref:F-box domain-containing protein n=1 Tax=Kwoniella dejecticola CBS 10117 TaxID=1296121 RepID=A0A1A6AH90_9TREE|nr:uncharacterized protein I303_01253 [Kwoniella dejecticola CBS 10117]OBR89426.1 hypothetical protein I303_01253 [Kwoniella dejecticola CBS 10117]